MQTRYPQTFFPGMKYRPYMKFAEVASPHGHDGFLIDFELLKPLLTAFIETVAPARVPWLPSVFRATRMAYFGARLVPATYP